MQSGESGSGDAHDVDRGIRWSDEDGGRRGAPSFVAAAEGAQVEDDRGRNIDRNDADGIVEGKRDGVSGMMTRQKEGALRLNSRGGGGRGPRGRRAAGGDEKRAKKKIGQTDRSDTKEKQLSRHFSFALFCILVEN
jgi:hypothetical protein